MRRLREPRGKVEVLNSYLRSLPGLGNSRLGGATRRWAKRIIPAHVYRGNGWCGFFRYRLRASNEIIGVERSSGGCVIRNAAACGRALLQGASMWLQKFWRSARIPGSVFFFFAQFLLLAPNLSLPIFYSIFRIKEVLFFLSCLFIDFRCFKVKTRSCFFLSMIALSRKEIATRRKKKRNFKSALPRFWAGSQLLH